MNIEGYYKNFSQLENINRDKIFTDDQAHADKPDAQKKDFIIETGVAKGADMTLKYEHNNFYLWLVYSQVLLSRRWNSGISTELRPPT
ncbi:MAG: hypothetical protein IPP51_04030 [Bacteroidetes bacterium]|nr:hypothetical protein [Bacteroidota bacterium]